MKKWIALVLLASLVLTLSACGVDDGDLFDTSYPWIAAADIADDGSILVLMSDTRTDESTDEVLVFKLSGF